MDKEFVLKELKEKNQVATLIYSERGSLVVARYTPGHEKLFELIRVDERFQAITLNSLSAINLTDPRGIDPHKAMDILMFTEDFSEDPEEEETE